MELVDLLIKNNFSEKEAKIYLACLQLKIANASTIARISGENRSTTYSVLKELQKKGFINEIDKNKVASYSAISPETIIKKLQTQMEDFKELLPAFSAFTEKRGIAPKVQFFEGIPGIIDIYHNILNSQVDICSFLGTADFPPQIQKYLKTIFFPTKLEKGAFSKVILSDTATNKKIIKKFPMKKLKREWRTVEGLLFPENIIINLYGPNQVMIAVFTENEPFGLIISSHYLYEALMGIFKSLRGLSPETSS